jgi:hypothetical protein
VEFRQIRKKFLEFKLKQHGIGDKEFEAKALNIADAVTVVALNADAANSSFKLFLEDIKKYFANEWKWDRLPISEVKRYNERRRARQFKRLTS